MEKENKQTTKQEKEEENIAEKILENSEEKISLEELEERMEEEIQDSIDEMERPNPYYFEGSYPSASIKHDDPYKSHDWFATCIEHGYEGGVSTDKGKLTTGPEYYEIPMDPEEERYYKQMEKEYEPDYIDNPNCEYDSMDYEEKIPEEPIDEQMDIDPTLEEPKLDLSIMEEEEPIPQEPEEPYTEHYFEEPPNPYYFERYMDFEEVIYEMEKRECEKEEEHIEYLIDTLDESYHHYDSMDYEEKIPEEPIDEQMDIDPTLEEPKLDLSLMEEEEPIPQEPEEPYTDDDFEEPPNPYYFEESYPTKTTKQEDPYESKDWFATCMEYGYEGGVSTDKGKLTTGPEYYEIPMDPEEIKLLKKIEQDEKRLHMEYLADTLEDDINFEVEDDYSFDDDELQLEIVEDLSQEPVLEEPEEEKVEAEIIKKYLKQEK